jgi:chemotaxis protein MotB
MEAENEEKEVQIADLGRRLNAALATKVQELARFRSDFFGRLRELLGDRQDIRVVGDRFVFQSEVLFASGSAELEPEGRKQLSQLASALAEIAATIPEDIDWVLRVDGHTDRRPISTPEFPSNWELSTARAISVVKFLIIRGIGPNRLAATGFGQFQPLDTGSDEIAFRRNRRIELKLTQR